MIFKRKFSYLNGAYITSEFVILNILLNSAHIFKVLPNKNAKIVYILALIFIAWLFIKQLISFRIKLKESDLDAKEKQRGYTSSISYSLLIILITVMHIVFG